MTKAEDSVRTKKYKFLFDFNFFLKFFFFFFFLFEVLAKLGSLK
jgi:hypothetical protein